MIKRKNVKTDIEKLNAAKEMYQSQVNSEIVLKDSQIVDMALAHAIGMSVEIETKKNKNIIKCKN